MVSARVRGADGRWCALACHMICRAVYAGSGARRGEGLRTPHRRESKYDELLPSRREDQPWPGTMESVTDGQRHLTVLCSCAANCLLYEQDPGPTELNIGSELEPHMVSRSHAWRDYYAHHLITSLKANPARLRQCSESAHELLDKERPDDWTAAQREEANQFWQCAVDIADMAIEIVEVSGAATDEQARQRLMAGSHHLQMQTAFGAIPDIVAQSGADLIDKLDRIDQRDPGD